MSSHTHKVGISFREVMSGGFALGATDPAEGEKQGRAQGSEMTMHGAIDIDDIDQFIAEANHPGVLTGTLDFTPFGDGLAAASGGIFNLFSPTSDPKLKLMVYEMGFQHGGKSYYMAGQKNVKDDPIFDLWRDTTTLYSKLYEGTDKSGPVVGAGILTLGVKQLIQLISTVKTPGSDSFTESSEAIAKFGHFFLGELWDTYARHAKP
jgi:cholesterol oxidase